MAETHKAQAREVISQYAATASVGLEYLIATAIREAVEEEREACAKVADEARSLCLELVSRGIRWEEETVCAAEAKSIARAIRARSTASPTAADKEL